MTSFILSGGGVMGYKSILEPMLGGIPYIASINVKGELENRRVSFISAKTFTPQPDSIKGIVRLEDSWPISGVITYGTIQPVKGDELDRHLMLMQWFVCAVTTAYVCHKDGKIVPYLPALPSWMIERPICRDILEWEQVFWQSCWDAIAGQEPALGQVVTKV
ncbi:MAG: hypothetical protein Q8P33_03295 [bacterium]|nr:hypothetical protein [bacterium]